MSYFKAKMHKFDFGWFPPQTRWGRLQHFPDPLAGFQRPTSKGREGEGTGRGGRKEEGIGNGRGGKGSTI